MTLHGRRRGAAGRSRNLETEKSLRAELRRDPSDHWLMTRLSATLYEARKYKDAAIYAKRALLIQPTCPLVKWDLAGALDMLGKERQAIRLWSGLVRRGAARIAKGTCGEGLSWSRALVVDCYYRLALAHYDVGERKKAWRDLATFVRLRRRWRGGLFRIGEARDVARRWRLQGVSKSGSRTSVGPRMGSLVMEPHGRRPLSRRTTTRLTPSAG